LGEFDGHVEERERLLENVRRAGIEVVELPPRSIRHMVKHVRDLHRDLVRRDIGVVIVQQHIDPRYVSLGFRFQTALVLHDPQTHSGDYASTYPLPVRALARVAEVTASARILHSARLIPQLRPLLRALPTGIVPHGVDVSSEAAQISDPPRIALVGRLMPYKGINVALDAFREVARARPDCVLVLAGRGRMGDAIRTSAPDGVELHDRYIPEQEMHELLEGARVVILPYLDATQSGVGLQAISRGIPCIVSDAGALPDLVPPTRPWVVPVRDVASLSAAILSLLEQDASMRDEVLAWADKQFAWHVVARRLLQELERLDVLKPV
jgi:glycosyltransferase involved in cell wall biosynthesis